MSFSRALKRAQRKKEPRDNWAPQDWIISGRKSLIDLWYTESFKSALIIKQHKLQLFLILAMFNGGCAAPHSFYFPSLSSLSHFMSLKLKPVKSERAGSQKKHILWFLGKASGLASTPLALPSPSMPWLYPFCQVVPTISILLLKGGVSLGLRPRLPILNPTPYPLLSSSMLRQWGTGRESFTGEATGLGLGTNFGALLPPRLPHGPTICKSYSVSSFRGVAPQQLPIHYTWWKSCHLSPRLLSSPSLSAKAPSSLLPAVFPPSFPLLFPLLPPFLLLFLTFSSGLWGWLFQNSRFWLRIRCSGALSGD